MIDEQMDLLVLLQEQMDGPLPCPHQPTMKNGGWSLERDPQSAYYGEWVHADPRCRRSKFPGKHKQEVPGAPSTVLPSPPKSSRRVRGSAPRSAKRRQP